MQNSFSIDITVKSVQYKDEDIYLFTLVSKSPFISSSKGFTNKKGIEQLNQGVRPDKTFYFELLSKEDLNLFRTMYFDEALNLFYNKDEVDFFEKINDENYDLYYIDTSTNLIKNHKDEIQPLFIHFSNPLYLINNKDFDLNNVLEVISKDKRFVSLFKENNRYEKILKSIDSFSITNIPYYNSEDDCNKYINIGFIPTDEDWKFIINFVTKNNLIRKDGYVKDFAKFVIFSGILGFTFTNKECFIYDFIE